jgi:AcrR family transcriptional regulator
MPYRRTENVARKLAARHEAILQAAGAAAAEHGMAALQIAPVAQRAGIATGTVYRYFPSKTDLVSALAGRLAMQEAAALAQAARSAPGPLSALAAVTTAFALRALTRRRLVSALMVEPVDADIDAARAQFRQTVTAQFHGLIDQAIGGRHLPVQDAGVASAALVGALIEGMVGPRAPVLDQEPGAVRARVQTLALLALRALGVVDARARGLVVQIPLPDTDAEG